MTNEQFKQMMVKMEELFFQLAKICVGLAALMSEGQRKSYEQGMKLLQKEWDKTH